MKRLSWVFLLLIIIIYCYFRLTPIINRTVPYTYDQGRDFLKIEEIFRDKNITFIGPTTGIQGVFHGVWWYYFLIVPYLLFGGWPQGFYLALFILSLISNLFFYKFIEKNYSRNSAVLFLVLTTASPFFVRMSFFASNNILSPFFVMLLIYSVFSIISKKNPNYLLLTGLSLGFIFETEMAFGLFIIPSFIITFLIIKEVRTYFSKIKSAALFFAGLLPPFIPRLLFELKNNFSQTRSFLAYFGQTKTGHPVQFIGLVQERIATFWQYWTSLFYNNNLTASLLTIILLAGILLVSWKNLIGVKKIFINFLILLLFFTFIFSLLNKNNFFWSYYLDGIQFIFIIFIITGFNLIEKLKKFRFLPYLIVAFLFVSNLLVFAKENSANKKIPLIGLRADDTIVQYIINKNTGDNFCLRIYTPPVFPFTYRYLLDYYTRSKNIEYPSEQTVDEKCWYIIDYDEDKERVDGWKKKNIPEKGKLVEKKLMDNKTQIELWKVSD